MSLRPPSTPSPSPHENGKAASRQSMGPSTRGAPGLPPASPRLGAGAGTGTRPTSELLGNGAGMFQSPEADAIEQWFDSLQNYETTLEEMAAASLDVNFKEELSAIEQWFKVLSEAERTAALYSLLQHSTQVQIRFFITVLTQMSKSDPMTALLSPQIGGSMQSQMEAKLASIKSPSLKSGLPASPTMRNFAPGNRSSLALDSTSNFLSPESAATSSSNDAAATLAQQRAKLKASSAAAHPHRISAPVLTTGNIDGRPAWTSGSQLGQVSEQNTPAQEGTVSRPKSTEFTGGLSPRPGAVGGGEVTVPANDSWASMVNTPLIPMFKNDTRPQNLDAAANKLSDWSNKSAAPGVPRMGDPTIHRRTKPASTDGRSDNNSQLNVYDDNGNLIGQAPNQSRGGAPRNVGGNNNNSFGGGPGGWSQTRSPALSNTSSNRFGGNDDAGNLNLNGLNGLGMPFNMGMGSPTLGMGMPGLAGMASMNPFNMNMLNMGLTPEQLLAAQLAATGFGQPNWMGMQPVSAGLNGRRGPQSGRSPGLKSASSVGSRADGGTPKAEDDVDPALLNDVPAWLRSLRLHKYTPNFEGCKWQDMVVMDEAALEAKGVAALGARRKMLKTFDLVRKKMGMDDGPASSAPPTSATLKSP